MRLKSFHYQEDTAQDEAKMYGNIIKSIKARKVVDTRTMYTIEVDITTEGGFGRATAPLGAPASRSEWEPPAYPPDGIDEAIEKVNDEIAPKLIGLDASRQELIDHVLREIDGTPNFARIGGNTAIVVSIATAKAAASALGLPLYRYLGTPFASELSIPIANIIGGGPHASKGKAPDFQEHQIIPVGAKSMVDAIHAVVLAHRKTKELCMRKDPEFTGGYDCEGAWIPHITDREALEMLIQVRESIRDETGVETYLGIDCAAGSLWDKDKEIYVYKREGVKRSRDEQLEYISELIETFPLYFVEDPFHDDDYESFKELTKKYGNKHLICGDDLFSTNFNRLLKGIKMDAANSVMIKENAVGTLTDTYRTVELARRHGYVVVKSCRSGETEDTAIAHLAIAWGCPFNKFAVAEKGAAKLNELLRIEEELGPQAKMPTLRILP